MNLSLIVGVLSLCVGFVYSDSATANARTVCRNACSGKPKVLFCASNGVTYDNSCQFECALAVNSRLHKVKDGSCTGTPLKEYRKETTTMSPILSPYGTRLLSDDRSTSDTRGSISRGWKSWIF